MPTYDYICKDCGHEMEAFQRMSDPVLVDCPSCTQPALHRKIGTGAGLIFKGGGFYETDFKDRKGEKPKAENESAKSADSSDSPKPAAGSTPAAEPKPATEAKAASTGSGGRD